MKVSFFKIGLSLTIIGMIWISVVFLEGSRTSEEFTIKQSNSNELKLFFEGNDIGFYKIFMPEFAGNELFIQILDVNDSIIAEQSVQTKMSVGYFDFYENGKYTLKITNISKNQINVEVEFGNTNSKNLIPAGIFILTGSLIMIGIAFLKLKNYNIEQPDENIS